MPRGFHFDLLGLKNSFGVKVNQVIIAFSQCAYFHGYFVEGE